MVTMWSVRTPNSKFDPSVDYANYPECFTLEFHHGGEFTDFPCIEYKGGRIDYIDKVNSDLFSVIIVNDMLVSLGYSEEDIVTYHFRIPGEVLDLGLRPLGNAMDVLKLLNHIEVNKVIEVYVEHLSTFPRMQNVVEAMETEKAIVSDLNLVNSDKESESSDEGSDGDQESESSDEDNDHQEGDINEAAKSKNVCENDSDDSDYIVDPENLVQDVNVYMDEIRVAVDFDISDREEENDDDGVDAQQVDFDAFDSLSDTENDTPLQAAVRNVRKRKKQSHQNIGPFYVGQPFLNREEIKGLVKRHAVDSRRQLFITKNDKTRFRVICLGGIPTLTIGESNMGRSKEVNMVNVSGTSKGKKAKATPKPKKKIPPPTCPWTLFVSNKKGDGNWAVKTYINEHQCLQTRDVKLCTISWLAKQIEPTIKIHPGVPLRVLQEELQKKLQVEITRPQIFKAKMRATKKILGDHDAQYKYLWDYAEEIFRSNPGSTVRIDVEPGTNPNSPTRQFRRVYICLAALKASFKLGRRPILGLDGCFLKGPFPGQILTAVGVDGNNGIFPVAYAVVEAESVATWTWFLQLLGDDMDLDSNNIFTFISDRQKGIIPAISKVYPSAEHRFCLRHIHENMKGEGWRGPILKNMLWNCATATTTAHFETNMKKILSENKELHAWLQKIPSRHWSRAYFSGKANCDVLLNNLCEVFNRQLVDGRDKPIITCLEFIREYLMKRTMVVLKMIAKCQGPLTPYATKKLDEIKNEAGGYTVIWTGEKKFQVNGENETRAVNLDQKSCGCRRWELTGIPCKHAVACIWNMRMHGFGEGIPEKWVDQAYWLDTWKSVYTHTINPINGRDLWPHSQCPTTLTAPKLHKQAGRPKKKRRKSAGEVEEANAGKISNKGKEKEKSVEVVEKLTEKIAPVGKMPRVGNSVTCDKCKQKGHNKRTCGKGPVKKRKGEANKTLVADKKVVASGK